MSERTMDPWKVAKPIRIDAASEEAWEPAPRPCDLVVCPSCLAVRYIGGLQLEERQPPAPNEGLFSWSREEAPKPVEGIFCPGCDQLLFDREAFIEHRAEQRQYDAELKRRKRAAPGVEHDGGEDEPETDAGDDDTPADGDDDQPDEGADDHVEGAGGRPAATKNGGRPAAGKRKKNPE